MSRKQNVIVALIMAFVMSALMSVVMNIAHVGKLPAINASYIKDVLIGFVASSIPSYFLPPLLTKFVKKHF